MTTPEKQPDRTRVTVLADIEAKIASIDGIATSDAFALGALVKEYGDCCAGEAIKTTLSPLLEGMMTQKKKPWEQ